MYHYLTGRLIEKNPTSLVVETGGIGYQVLIPVSTFAALPEVSQTIRILTHFVVREDAQALYGFLTEGERVFFRLLLSVSGIGPKSALTVLSGMPLQDLKKAIVDGNVALLTGIPGIGRKTAERLVIELREKILTEKPHAGAGSSLESLQAHSEIVEDSLRALVELGYRRLSAQQAVQKALKGFEKGSLNVSDLIRASLKHI